MKFTDGYWLLRDGVQATYPVQVHEVEATADSLTVHAPTKRVVQRGDTLNQPVLAVAFSSPLPDVIRVTLAHFAGQLPGRPQFPLLADAAPEVLIADGAGAATLTSGRLSVRVPRTGDWRVEFLADGRAVTSSGPRRQRRGWPSRAGRSLRERLSVGVGEAVYGLGERFTAFVKNGQVVDIWNKDGGTASEQAH